MTPLPSELKLAQSSACLHYYSGTRLPLAAVGSQQRHDSVMITSVILQPTFGPGENPWGRLQRTIIILARPDIHWDEQNTDLYLSIWPS